MTRPPAVLYVTYDGALDPLGQSQVVPYIEGLAALGYRFHLISFEKPARWAPAEPKAALRRRLEASGIRWHPLAYRKRPPVLGTALDLAQGVAAAARIHAEDPLSLVHARSYPSALIALRLHRKAGVPFLFDMRGFYPEERLDGGLWSRSGGTYQVVKRLERDFLHEAAGVVTLTEASLPILSGELERAGGRGPIRVIPTSVSLERFQAPPPPAEPFTLAYFGSLGTWYLLHEMLRLGRAVLDEVPGSRLLFVVNEGQETLRSEAEALGIPADRLDTASVSHDAIPSALQAAHATFFLIRPGGSKIASAATKFGESMALGRPVAANRGVGDTADVLDREGVGVVVERFHEDEYRRVARELARVARRDGIGTRCREVAGALYSMEGAVASYAALYRDMGVTPPGGPAALPPDRRGPPRGRRRRIVVLSPYPQDRAPSQRLKYEQYFESWREAGFDVDVRPFWDEAAWSRLYRSGGLAGKGADVLRGLARRWDDRLAALRADLVYVHLWATPLGPPGLERELRSRGVPLVYDLDDFVHLPHASGANPFMRWLRPPGKVEELLGLAHQVIVCTEHLAGLAAGHNPNVTNISSTIRTDLYLPRPHRERVRGVVVGWSGSHSTSRYLGLLEGPLRDVQASDDIRVRVIGDASVRVPGVTLEATDWTLASEVEDLSELDVGVYPLPEEEWVRGKSGLKALQYMALEIPPVVQRTAVNVGIVQDGENGLVAGSPREWRAALEALVRDPSLRRRLGVAGRATVEARYSVSANATRYLDVLERALSDGGRAP
jgi:glycosyltransferase involved in cell wall biosynthesis